MHVDEFLMGLGGALTVSMVVAAGEEAVGAKIMEVEEAAASPAR
jgi:hypothetical protein